MKSIDQTGLGTNHSKTGGPQSHRPGLKQRAILPLLIGAVIAVLVGSCVQSLDESDLAEYPAQTEPGDGNGEGEGSGDATSSERPDPPVVSEDAELSVLGNRLVDAEGNEVILRGFNLAGTEYACVQGWGIFDGPADAEVLAGMAEWDGNAVRVLLNEHCWLGRNGVDPEFGGQNYRTAVLEWIDLARANGMWVVASLIWSDAGDAPAHDQAVMANTDHSVEFWDDFARALGDRDGIILDLYGEPHDIDWECWQSGCITDEGYPAAGMQQLLDVVRDAGSTRPVMLSGLEYANDLSGWLGYPVVDSIQPQQLLAGWHSYDFNNCTDPGCWDSTVAPVAAAVPIVTAEFGGSTCDGTYVEPLMDWLDAHGISYLAWTWNPWGDCADGPDLILDHYGTPNDHGAAVKNHYQQVANGQ